MNPFSTSLRVLALCTLALPGPGCLSGSLSLGDDDETATDTGSESGDAPDLRWSTRLPDVIGIDVAIAPDGTSYVFGQAGFTPQGDGGIYDDRWLGRFDAEGVLLWEIREPQPFDDFVYPVAISVDGAGDVYLAYNDHLTKLDADGNEQWSVAIPGRLGEVVARPEGGAIAVGSAPVGDQGGAAWAQAFDADGNPGWTRTFDGVPMTYSEITDVALTGDGGVVVGGRLGLEVGSSRSQAWVATLELDDGADRWQTTLSDGVATDRVVGVGVAADGTTLVAGTSDAAWVEGLDPSGNVQWTWINDVAEGTDSLAVFPDGSFAVGDGLLVDPEQAEQCLDGLGPCPTTMRVFRAQADRSPAWAFETNECHTALVVVPTADGELRALANCYDDDARLAMGLYQLDS